MNSPYRTPAGDWVIDPIDIRALQATISNRRALLAECLGALRMCRASANSDIERTTLQELCDRVASEVGQ